MFERNSIRKTGLVLVAAVLMLGLGTGCNTTRNLWGGTRSFIERGLERPELKRVKPWERDVLSREDMAWAPDGLRKQRRTHIAFSKEGSLVGGSAGGGGCGCN